MAIHEHWFGVTYTFICPRCRRTSEQKTLLNSPTDDVYQLRQAIDQHRPVCQRCATLAAPGTEVTVNLVPSTPTTAEAFFPPQPE